MCRWAGDLEQRWTQFDGERRVQEITQPGGSDDANEGKARLRESAGSTSRRSDLFSESFLIERCLVLYISDIIIYYI